MKHIKSYNYYSYIFYLLASVLFLFSCQKEDVYFTKTPHVISFHLIVDGKRYIGDFQGDKILFRIPTKEKLIGAKAEFKLPEHTTVHPLPKDVSDWETVSEIIVKSEGKNYQKRYSISFERTGSIFHGNIQLRDEDDIKAFSQLGITIIDGNLILGEQAHIKNNTGHLDPEDVEHFDLQKYLKTTHGLSTVEEISGSLIINRTFVGANLKGLSNLKKIEINFEVNGRCKIREIKLDALEKVGGYVSISIPFYSNLKMLSMPKLNYVGDRFHCRTPLHTIDLPELEYVGRALVFEHIQCSTLQLPKLKHTDLFGSIDAKQIKNIYLPELTEVKQIYVNGNIQSPKIKIPKVKELEHFYLTEQDTYDWSFLKNIRKIGQFSIMSSHPDKAMDEQFKYIKNIEFDKLSIAIRKLKGNELDFSEYKIKSLLELKLPEETYTRVRLAEVMHSKLHIIVGGNFDNPNCPEHMCDVVGVKETTELIHVKTPTQYEPTYLKKYWISFPNLIKADSIDLWAFEVNMPQLKECRSLKGRATLPSLELITENFDVYHTTYDIPKLKTIGGRIKFNVKLTKGMEDFLAQFSGIENVDELQCIPELDDFTPFAKMALSIKDPKKWILEKDNSSPLPDYAYFPTLKDMHEGRYKKSNSN